MHAVNYFNRALTL